MDAPRHRLCTELRERNLSKTVIVRADRGTCMSACQGIAGQADNNDDAAFEVTSTVAEIWSLFSISASLTGQSLILWGIAQGGGSGIRGLGSRSRILGGIKA